MTAQAGKDLLIRLAANGQTTRTVAGLRARSISFNNRSVDTTSADSPGGWRTLLSGGGLRSAAVAGSGVFVDDAADESVRAAAFSGETAAVEIVVPDFGVISGPFQVTALEYAGRHDGELTFAMTLESAGAVDFVPEAAS